MNDKSGLDLQSLIDIVHNYQRDAAKSIEKDKLLTYLTTSFDRYVSTTKKSSRTNRNTIQDYDLTDTEGVYKKRRQTPASGESLKQEVINIKSASSTTHDSQNDNQDDVDEDEEFENEINKKHENKSKLKRTLSTFRRVWRIMCITKGKRYGNFLLVLFIFVKILYTINAIVQLFMLNQFLGNDYLILGIEILIKIWNGDDWSQINRFPRVTLCDFRIREVGIVHRYTVQCVLSINLFNEKIFIFIWYWLCLISLFNLFDLITWSYTLILNSHERYMYIKRRLMTFDNETKALKEQKHHQNTTKLPYLYGKNKKLFQKFVNNYLKEDGVLALRLLSRNSHDLIVSEVISKLFDIYLDKQRSKHDTDDDENEFNEKETESQLNNSSVVITTLSRNVHFPATSQSNDEK